jgi:hypothetical protein
MEPKSALVPEGGIGCKRGKGSATGALFLDAVNLTRWSFCFRRLGGRGSLLPKMIENVNQKTEINYAPISEIVFDPSGG